MIILQCVKEENKLRIRFYCHFDIEDSCKIDYNKYDSHLNCKFPKNKRKIGRFYGIDDCDIKLNTDMGQPFYKTYGNERDIKVFNNKTELEDFLGLNKEPTKEKVKEPVEDPEENNLSINHVIEEVRIDVPVTDIEPKKSIFEKLFSFFW